MPTRTLLFAVVVVLIAGAALAAFVIDSSDSSTEAESKVDVLNRKRIAAGMPTLDPETVDDERTRAAERASADDEAATPFPTSAPAPASCGPLEGSRAILERYGGVVSGCDQLSPRKVITTSGKDGRPGAIAVLECHPDDRACIRGDEPTMGETWEVYPAPRNGSIKVLAALDEERLAVNIGGRQCSFSFTTREILC